MRHTSIRVITLLLASVTLLPLAACGGDDGSDTINQPQCDPGFVGPLTAAETAECMQ